MVFLGIVGWIVIGLVVGFIANKCVNLRGDDPRLGIAAACAGGVVAGAVYSFFAGGVSAWSPWALVCSAVGGAAGAATWHLVRSRSISRTGYTTRSSY